MFLFHICINMIISKRARPCWKLFQWSQTQLLHKSKSVYSPEPRHLFSFITHSYSLSCWQETKCKWSTGAMLLPPSLQQQGGNEQRQMFACVQRKTWLNLHRQTPGKGRFHWKCSVVLNFFCLTCVHSLVSLVNSDTLTVKSLRKLWRQLGVC